MVPPPGSFDARRGLPCPQGSAGGEPLAVVPECGGVDDILQTDGNADTGVKFTLGFTVAAPLQQEA